MSATSDLVCIAPRDAAADSPAEASDGASGSPLDAAVDAAPLDATVDGSTDQ